MARPCLMEHRLVARSCRCQPERVSLVSHPTLRRRPRHSLYRRTTPAPPAASRRARTTPPRRGGRRGRRYYDQLAQIQKDRLTAATSAMTADTGLRNSTGGQTVASNAGGTGVTDGPAPIPGGVVPETGIGFPGVAVVGRIRGALACRPIRRRGWMRAHSGRSRHSSTSPAT